MLKKENFTEEHIRDLQSASHRDPLLLERSVYAFGLLEAITRVGMPFIFKGGTCLMLLLERPMRLSTDIDIIVAPGTDLNTFIEEAGKIFPFVSVEEQVRKGKNNIVSGTSSSSTSRRSWSVASISFWMCCSRMRSTSGSSPNPSKTS